MVGDNVEQGVRSVMVVVDVVAVLFLPVAH